MRTATCRQCEHPLTSYPGGKRACVPCRNAKRNRWRNANRQHYLQTRRNYYANNLERERQRGRDAYTRKGQMIETCQPAYRYKDSDCYETPSSALEPLLPYLKSSWSIWEPAEGNRAITKKLANEGFITIGTDIQQDTDQGFLTIQPCFDFDCIVTNPPYSLMQEFLERCYHFQKPFALLMPIRALDTKKRQALYQRYGIDLLMLPGQIDFRHMETNKRLGLCVPGSAGSYSLNLWSLSKGMQSFHFRRIVCLHTESEDI
jgi:hypothetical protein